MKFSVYGQWLTAPSRNPNVVRNSREYIYAHFTFSDDWDGTIKTAIFALGDKTYEVLLDGNNTCLMPWEATDAASFFVSVLGVLGDVRITTNEYKIATDPSGAISGQTPQPPTPDVYAQIIGRVQDAEDAYATIETAEGGRVSAEMARVENESGRVSAETERVEGEKNRVNAEQSRALAEQNRAESELDRVNAESARQTVETDRVSAEGLRANAEQERASAENARAAAEQERINVENSRASAEAARVTAENERATAETGRVSAENGRVTAESKRATDESTRAGHESSRVSAENLRVASENARLSAEQSRVTAESGRVSAETARANAESTRVANETARQAQLTAAVDAAESSATSAQASAEAATSSLSDLNAAIDTMQDDIKRLDLKMGVHKYIIRYDKINSQCVRLGDAAGITTDITHFAHRGSVDPDYSNPFDSIYPWNSRKLCKVDLALYQQICTDGGDIEDCVSCWEDEPGFGLGASVPGMDMVYTPTFWLHQWQDENYVYVGVADGAVPGWTKRPAIIGARYFAADDGNGGLTSLAGTIAKRGVAMNTLHSMATAKGMTLDDIYTWSDDTVLMCVEFATLNTQNAVGTGCSDFYAQGATGSEYKPAVDAAAGDTVLALPNALADKCLAGGVLDIGTSNGTLNICSVVVQSVAALDATNANTATHKAVTVSALPTAVTASHVVSLHGCYNAQDTEIGSKSGFIGTANKCNSYYRGRIAHGNYWRYVLGAYRQKNTGHIWIAHNSAEASQYDALNANVHIDTGFVLPQRTDGAAVSGYINELHHSPTAPLSPFCKTIGGNSANPVGDYAYVPEPTTVDTILIAGASAGNGTSVGRFYGYWDSASGGSSWGYAALLFLKSPIGG